MEGQVCFEASKLDPSPFLRHTGCRIASDILHPFATWPDAHGVYPVRVKKTASWQGKRSDTPTMRAILHQTGQGLVLRQEQQPGSMHAGLSPVRQPREHGHNLGGRWQTLVSRASCRVQRQPDSTRKTRPCKCRRQHPHRRRDRDGAALVPRRAAGRAGKMIPSR